MRAKTLAVLAVFTLLTVGAAAVALVLDSRDTTPERVGDAVFPGLIERVNEVGKILIRHADGTLTVVRDGDGWALAESDGYPVRQQAAQRVVVEFTEMNYLAPKTRLPQRYDRLDLQDPDAEGSRSKLVQLFDTDGEVLATAIVGKRRFSVPGVLPGGLYIRLPGEEQAWLVSGGLQVDPHPREWLEKELIDIDLSRIARVTIEHPNGEVVRIHKAPQGEYDFAIADMPEGKKLVFEGAPQYIARSLDNLALEDVRKAENVSLDASSTITATYETEDGLLVHLAVEPREDGNWTRISAEAAADAAAPTKMAEEAAALNARLGPWVYNVSNYRLADFKKGPERLLEDAKPSG